MRKERKHYTGEEKVAIGALFIKRRLDGVSGRCHMFQKHKQEEKANKLVEKALDELLSTPAGGTKSELLNPGAPKGNRNQSIFCNSCGAKNPQDSANCYNCGQKVGRSSTPVRPNYLEKEMNQQEQTVKPHFVGRQEFGQELLAFVKGLPAEKKAELREALMSKNVPEPAGNPSLHASLASHYGLSIEQSSYSDLKDRFLSELDQKRNRGVAPDAEEETLLAQIVESQQYFFFTAVDRNGLTRFFDVMEDDRVFSIAETATTAPRLAQCRETVYMASATAEFHHVHRIYGSHKKSEMPNAFAAIDQFGKACGLTGIVTIAERLNQKRVRPTWSLIFQRLGCSGGAFSFKSVTNFRD